MTHPKKISPDFGLEPDILMILIKKYKSNPCLWDTTHKHYHNKAIKSAAWDELLRIWRKFEPSATQHDVKIKILNMRTNYTRQRKKVESNAAQSCQYTPTLWYYKYMNFLSGKIENDSGDKSDPDSDPNDETVYAKLPRGKKRPASTLIDQDNEPETSAAIDASAAAFGRSVGAQLHHLSKIQRCIAEKLISDVIYHGKLEQLSINASIQIKDTESSVSYAKDNIGIPVIPKSEPSWHETALDTGSGQSSSSYTFITNTNEDLARTEIDEIDETETAVNFIKKTDETENYYSQDDLDEQINAIDIIKKELI